MIAFIIYLQLFAAYWNGMILYFVPGLFKYKNFVIGILIITILTCFYIIYKKKYKINKKTLTVILISSVVLLLMYITNLKYYQIEGELKARYLSQFLAYGGQVMPTVVLASLIESHDKVISDMKKMAPKIALIFGFVALLSVLRPNATAENLLTFNENGLNYQSSSYLAAFSTALMISTIVGLFDKNSSKKSSRKVMFFGGLLVIINLLTILLSGGRGGFVAYFIFIAINVLFILNNNKINANKLITIVLGLIAIVIGISIMFELSSDVSIKNSGLSRILNLLEGGGDVNRFAKFNIAMNLFRAKPIFGNGIGSIFYELGEYSHNIFTDILSETGVIGILIFFFITYKTIIKIVKLVHLDKGNILYLNIFLCGFIFSLFSGYYLSIVPIWMISSLIFTSSIIKNKEIKNKEIKNKEIKNNFNYDANRIIGNRS